MAPIARVKFSSAALAIVAAWLLSGCASVYRVDNQVESFSRWADGAAPSGPATTTPAPPQTYRFVRLPSRSTGAAADTQVMLEQQAEEALKPLGWVVAASPIAAAPWTVEVAAQGARLPRAP